MTTGGLKRVHILIIGVVLGILIAVGVFFAAIKPTQAQITDISSEKEGYDQKIATKPQEQKKLVQAKLDQVKKRIDLGKYEYAYMRIGPERAYLSMKDRQAAMILLWKEQANTLGPLIRNYLQKSGVRLLSAIQIPGAPVDPNQINPNEYEIPLGQVQVAGSFPQINNFLRRVQNAPRLIRVNNVELAGQSPLITATMDMTVIILPRDSDQAQGVQLASPDASGGGGYSPPPAPGGPSGYGGGGANGGGANGGGANGGGANGG